MDYIKIVSSTSVWPNEEIVTKLSPATVRLRIEEIVVGVFNYASSSERRDSLSQHHRFTLTYLLTYSNIHQRDTRRDKEERRKHHHVKVNVNSHNAKSSIGLIFY